MKVSFKLFWILCGGSSLVMNWNSSYSSMLLFNSLKLKSTCFSSPTAAWQVRSEAGRILTVSLFCFGVFSAVQTWGFWKCIYNAGRSFWVLKNSLWYTGVVPVTISEAKVKRNTVMGPDWEIWKYQLCQKQCRRKIRWMLNQVSSGLIDRRLLQNEGG